MASSLPLRHPTPPRRPLHSVAPRQKHVHFVSTPPGPPSTTPAVFAVQAASASTLMWGSPAKPCSAPAAPEEPEPSRPFFDGLQPLAYTGAALGIVPISFQPLRLSFHPLRSTLLYALLVQAFTWWEMFHIKSPWRNEQPAAAEDKRNDNGFPTVLSCFESVHTTVHLTGTVIVLVFWAELHKVHKIRYSCGNLLVEFGYVLWGRPKQPGPRRRPQHGLVWITTMALWLAPWMMVIAWGEYVEKGMEPLNSLAHTLINAQLLFGTIVLSLCFLRLQTFATGLLSELRQELVDPDLTPERVLEYRHTWTLLAGLNSGFIVTPISVLLQTVMLIFLVTLHSYEGVECLLADNLKVGIIIWLIGLPFTSLLFALCEVPHRSAGVIRRHFEEVLQMSNCRYENDKTLEEVHRFLEIVWWNSPVTTICGFFELKRSSFRAIVAMIVTYGLVLLQLNSSGHSIDLNRFNGTLPPQS